MEARSELSTWIDQFIENSSVYFYSINKFLILIYFIIILRLQTVCVIGSKGVAKPESDNYISKNIERSFYCYFTLNIVG